MSTTKGYTVRIAGSSDGGDRVPDLSPREAKQRWLNKLRVDKSESTVSAYDYRLRQFIEWCEENGITTVRELTGWDVETFETTRREAGVEVITLNNELGTLKSFFEYCARIDIADEGLPGKVDVPDLDPADEVSEDRLPSGEAERLLEYYSEGDTHGTRAHALLALFWYSGARMGAVRGLDLDDYDPDRQCVRFRHRPNDDCPLKNGEDGERVVALPDHVCDIVDAYIREHRYDKYDEFGRRPLITSQQQGRASPNAVRAWTYLATVPCHYRECPHGNRRKTCEYVDYSQISKCPSACGPHAIRTGSVTWQCNQDIPLERVSERVNTSIRVLKRHYDHQDPMAEMEERRRQYVDRLAFGEGGDRE
jgi:site-specific recombinase XerD